MKTLRELKARAVPVVEPQTSLAEAVQLLEEEPLQTVAIVGDEMYMGLLTPDALQSELIPPGADRSLLTVGPYLHPMRVVGAPDMAVETALAQLRRRSQEVLPVVENRIFLGVLTRQDLEQAEG